MDSKEKPDLTKPLLRSVITIQLPDPQGRRTSMNEQKEEWPKTREISLRDLPKTLNTPTGTLCLVLGSDNFQELGDQDRIVFDIPTGNVLYRLFITPKCVLSFLYSSPGLGALIAQISMDQFGDFDDCLAVLRWSSKGIKLSAGVRPDTGKGIIHVEGEKWMGLYPLVGSNGFVVELSPQMQHFQFRIGDKLVAEIPAINYWNFIKENAIELVTIAEEQSNNYNRQILICRLTIVMIVSGFETYARKRFIEMLKEGRTTNEQKFINKFLSTWERSSERIQEIQNIAMKKELSLLAYLIEKRTVNFQDLNQVKRAFTSTFNMRLADEVTFKSNEFSRVHVFIKYRHLISHSDPALTIMNLPKFISHDDEEPEFISLTHVKEAIDIFERLISSINRNSLNFPPKYKTIYLREIDK